MQHICDQICVIGKNWGQKAESKTICPLQCWLNEDNLPGVQEILIQSFIMIVYGINFTFVKRQSEFTASSQCIRKL